MTDSIPAVGDIFRSTEAFSGIEKGALLVCCAVEVDPGSPSHSRRALLLSRSPSGDYASDWFAAHDQSAFPPRPMIGAAVVFVEHESSFASFVYTNLDRLTSMAKNGYFDSVFGPRMK